MSREREIDSIGAILTARVAAMRARADSARACDLADDLQTIRRLALANGYAPMLPVIQALDHVLSKQVERAPIAGWLAILDDAIGCGNRHPRAEAAFAALCSSRLGC